MNMHSCLPKKDYHIMYLNNEITYLLWHSYWLTFYYLSLWWDSNCLMQLKEFSLFEVTGIKPWDLRCITVSSAYERECMYMCTGGGTFMSMNFQIFSKIGVVNPISSLTPSQCPALFFFYVSYLLNLTFS